MSTAHLVGYRRRDTAAHGRVLGRIVVGSLAYYASILLLHWLRPEVDPVARVTSEYAIALSAF